MSEIGRLNVMVEKREVEKFIADGLKRTKNTWWALRSDQPFLEGRSRVFFLHYPKCAGSSVSSAFVDCLKTWDYHDFRRCRELSAPVSTAAARTAERTVQEQRQSILHYWLSDETLRFVRGHFVIDESIVDTYQNTWNFVTLLREPVERWISWYFYNRHKDSSHAEITRPLDEFLLTDRAKRMRQDYARMLLGRQGGSSVIIERSALREAKSLLSQFKLVGTVEGVSTFERRVQTDLGWRIDIGHRNTNPVGEDSRDKRVTEKQYDQIRELCEVNSALYDFVRGRSMEEG